MNITKVLTTLCILACSIIAKAQDKIVYPDISYAVFCLKKKKKYKKKIILRLNI